MGGDAPGRLVDARVHRSLHDVDTPADVRLVRGKVGAARERFPRFRRVVIHVIRTRQDAEHDLVLNHRLVAGVNVCPDIAPPVDHRADAAKKLGKSGYVEVGIDLICWLIRERVDDVLRSTYERLIVDVWRHGSRIEQPCLVVWMLRVSSRAAGKEVPAESATGFADVEYSVEVLTVQLLAVQEVGHSLHLLPGLRGPPFFTSAA